MGQIVVVPRARLAAARRQYHRTVAAVARSGPNRPVPQGRSETRTRRWRPPCWALIPF